MELLNRFMTHGITKDSWKSVKTIQNRSQTLKFAHVQLITILSIGLVIQSKLKLKPFWNGNVSFSGLWTIALSVTTIWLIVGVCGTTFVTLVSKSHQTFTSFWSYASSYRFWKYIPNYLILIKSDSCIVMICGVLGDLGDFRLTEYFWLYFEYPN